MMKKYSSAYIDKRTQRVLDWLMGDIKDSDLSEEEQEEWHKISVMDDLLRKYIQKTKAISSWRKKFPEVKSITTAYAYYHKTQVVIGTSHHVNKQYHVHLMIDIIDRALKLCLDKKETKDIPRLLEQRFRYLGMDKEDEIDHSQIQRHIYTMKTDPRVLNMPAPSREEFDLMIKELDLDSSVVEKIYKDAESVPFKEKLNG